MGRVIGAMHRTSDTASPSPPTCGGSPDGAAVHGQPRAIRLIDLLTTDIPHAVEQRRFTPNRRSSGGRTVPPQRVSISP